MISVIISTYRPHYLDSLSQNIKETIGVPYEIIAIDNSGAKMGLCQLYNVGAKKAQYDIVCFVHEDVNILTTNWGIIVVDKFNSYPKLGLLGVAGGSYKTAVPSGWSFPLASPKTIYMNIVQLEKSSKELRHHNYSSKDSPLVNVASVDGVWFCTKKEVLNKFSFDEKTFTNFHCYDVDFSLSVHQEYEVAVTFEILLEHFSEGNFDKQWLSDTFKLHQKWNKILPVNEEKLTEKEQVREEEAAFYYLLKQMKNVGALDLNVYKILFDKNVIKVLSLKSLLKMAKVAGESILKKHA